MVSKKDWRSYPVTYRAEALQTLADWIKAGESGSLIGLPGAGKSNLLGFLSHRPEVLHHYLPADFGRLVLVQVDLNNLPGDDLATFFRVILRSLYEVRSQLSSLDEALASEVEQLYRKVEEKTDPFLSQSALREVLFGFRERQIRLVLVFDPFDQFCRLATTPMLDNLRGLRDGFKTTLCYIMGLRHEVTYLRSPVELGELFEIVDLHQHWLGAMNSEDARWVISQVEAATGQTFAAAQVEHLLDLTGGYPALLRAASLWLAKTAPLPGRERWVEVLLAESSIKNRLEDIRQGLTGEEEAALSVLQKAQALTSAKERQKSIQQISEKYQHVLTRLHRKSLCRKVGGEWQLFSPLFAQFVIEMEGVSSGQIRYDSQTRHFLVGEQVLAGLSERDRQLLKHFLDNPHKAHTVDDLIEAA